MTCRAYLQVENKTFLFDALWKVKVNASILIDFTNVYRQEKDQSIQNLYPDSLTSIDICVRRMYIYIYLQIELIYWILQLLLL